jgi:hypothetical protein
MTKPEAPPPLTAMAARQARLEATRDALFVRWREALETAAGCVSRAAQLYQPADGEPEMTRNRANKLTRRFALVEFAAQLRIDATGRPRGRQDRPKAATSKAMP